MRRTHGVVFALGLGLASCGGGARGAPAPVNVPEPARLGQSQQESKEMMGHQQNFMDVMNQTPSEQAGVRHDEDRAPVEREEERR